MRVRLDYGRTGLDVDLPAERVAGVLAYRLDTLIGNERAIRFYRELGFLEVAQRADSIIFVRRLPR